MGTDLTNSDPTQLTFAELQAKRATALRYLELVDDPNQPAPTGEYPLALAISLCFDGAGEDRVADLIALGADPNLPDPWSNFVMLTTTTSNVALVKRIVDSGLRLNETYETSRGLGHLTDGIATLLDHAYAVADYLDPTHCVREALANKHGDGLSGRRRFIYEVIELLEALGAKKASELASE